ncbi:MAG: DUF21 domain-containing protein, partial [Thermoanaerobaculia bacterium]|nr:DUF21 domain-containing protein [Thermoanaerobaculia bacterium]
MELPTPVLWLAIAFCASQSALFSGLNLAFFGVSRLRLEIESSTGDRRAARVLQLRRHPNALLTTILWGNVGINVLLTMLTDTLLTPIAAFVMSTVVITFLGEIFPQAYFSRHAKRMASLLAPVLRLYQILLFPVTWPTTKLLDLWLGGEEASYFQEPVLIELLRRHAKAREARDVGLLEGMGAANFLALDDLAMAEEGQPVHPDSIVRIEFDGKGPVFPDFEPAGDDPWLRRLGASGMKWVVLVDAADRPRLVIDADGFLRQALFDEKAPDPAPFCHRPVVVDDPAAPLGTALLGLEVDAGDEEDDVIDDDLILLWGEERRVITGADILGRLLRGAIDQDEEAGKSGG